MKLYFHTEEESMIIVLETIVDKVLGARISYQFIQRPHNGKHNLLKEIATDFKNYAEQWKDSQDFRVIVLVDRDRDDCKNLNNTILKIAVEQGLPCDPLHNPIVPLLTVIVIQELESWFLGDMKAIQTLFPNVVENPYFQTTYTTTDQIENPKEELLLVLQYYGHFLNYERLSAKTMAKKLAPHMTPDSNRSASFQFFNRRLQDLIQR